MAEDYVGINQGQSRNAFNLGLMSNARQPANDNSGATDNGRTIGVPNISKPSYTTPYTNSSGETYNIPSGNSNLQQATEVPTSSPQNTQKYQTNTSGNAAGGIVGAVFDMVHMVISDVMGVGQFFGLDDQSKTQKKQFEASMKESTRRFDKTFFENIRQFNLEYALKEFATRKGIQLQEVQQIWDRYTQGRTLDANMRTSRIASDKAQFDLNAEKKAYARKAKFSNQVMKAFTSILGKKKKTAVPTQEMTPVNTTPQTTQVT